MFIKRSFYTVMVGEEASSLLVHVQNKTLLPQKVDAINVIPTLLTGMPVSGARQRTVQHNSAFGDNLLQHHDTTEQSAATHFYGCILLFTKWSDVEERKQEGSSEEEEKEWQQQCFR